MAKAYKVGKSTSTQYIYVSGVKGKPSDYRVYLAWSGYSESYADFTGVKLEKYDATSWRITHNINTFGNAITVYWALVKKVNPSVGKAIQKFGSSMTKNYKLNVSSSCSTCKMLCNATGTIGMPSYSAGKFVVEGVGIAVEQTIRYAIMSGSNFLRDIKLL